MRYQTQHFTENLLDGLAQHRLTSMQRDAVVLILMDANERRSTRR